MEAIPKLPFNLILSFLNAEDKASLCLGSKELNEQTKAQISCRISAQNLYTSSHAALGLDNW